jgi:16S rRNA (guanine966-N2)-methyltransferase
MRIIAGQFRGRRIRAPVGRDTTRPMTDRVRQSLFDRLTVMQMLGGHVLDLFAGSGSLGLESLSRGADHCTFVERDAAARRVVEQNLQSLDLVEQATVLAIDALRPGWVDHLNREPVRLVFCDPPYHTTADAQGAMRVASLIQALAPVMEADGLLVLRTEVRVEPPAAVPGWHGPESHAYSSTALHFYVGREPSAR